MIECPVCHRVSHHPVDVRTGWCSGCERFTGKTAEEVRAVAAEFGAAGDVGVAAAILYRLDTHGAASASGCGYSEETCLRCGWTMGQPALNCQNDDTPHRFPSQLRELYEAVALAVGGDGEYLGDHIPQEVWDDLHERKLVITQTALFGDAETCTTVEGVEYLVQRLKG